MKENLIEDNLGYHIAIFIGLIMCGMFIKFILTKRRGLDERGKMKARPYNYMEFDKEGRWKKVNRN